MSLYGQWQTATISSGGMESAVVDLGRDYDYLTMAIPEMTNCIMYLKVSEITGGTYYKLGRETIDTADMSIFKKEVRLEDDDEDVDNSSMYNHAETLRLGGWRFVKVCTEEPQSAERSIRVRGMRY